MPKHFQAKKQKGWIYEHRHVAEQKIGRRLKKSESVHHIDGDKENNNPENIEVMNRGKHTSLHWEKMNAKQRLEMMAAAWKAIRKKKTS